MLCAAPSPNGAEASNSIFKTQGNVFAPEVDVTGAFSTLDETGGSVPEKMPQASYEVAFRHMVHTPVNNSGALDEWRRQAGYENEQISTALVNFHCELKGVSFTPYVGLGVGLALIETGAGPDGEMGGWPQSNVAESYLSIGNKKQTVFAGNFALGVGWKFSPRASVNLGYYALCLGNANLTSKIRPEARDNKMQSKLENRNMIQNVSIGAYYRF